MSKRWEFKKNRERIKVMRLIHLTFCRGKIEAYEIVHSRTDPSRINYYE
jgi:hypothetical protein